MQQQQQRVVVEWKLLDQNGTVHVVVQGSQSSRGGGTGVTYSYSPVGVGITHLNSKVCILQALTFCRPVCCRALSACFVLRAPVFVVAISLFLGFCPGMREGSNTNLAPQHAVMVAVPNALGEWNFLKFAYGMHGVKVAILRPSFTFMTVP